MPTTIKIKRGGASSNTAPSGLGAGELAVTYGTGTASNGGDRLYIGNSPANADLVIGGKYFMDMLDHAQGTLTQNSALIADTNKKLDNLKVDNIDLKGSAITTTYTNGDLDITPHGTGAVNFKGDGSSTVGTIKIFSETNAKSVTIKAPANSDLTSHTLTLPVNDGNANNMLVTNGSGVLSWSATVSATTGSFSGNVTSTGNTAGNVQVGITADNEIETSSGNLTIDSACGTVTIDDNLTVSASKTIDMGANRVTNIADPTSAQDAASKAYVDAVKQGLDVKDSVTCATTANLGYTYNNGAGTLTNGSNGAITLDGVALTANMRVLVKNQSTAAQNGIYYVSTAGAGGGSPAALVLTRATDANTGAELSGGTFVFVEQGTVAAENGYVFTHNDTPTLGTTSLTVSQFSGAGQIIAGTSLTKTGNTLNVATDGTTMFTLSDSLSVQSSGTAGQVLRSTGNTGQAAVYGQLDLANSNAVTGITAVANGGTGKNSVTAHLLMVGNGTSAFNTIAIGTSGQALLSGGSGSNPAFGDIDGGTF